MGASRGRLLRVSCIIICFVCRLWDKRLPSALAASLPERAQEFSTNGDGSRKLTSTGEGLHGVRRADADADMGTSLARWIHERNTDEQTREYKLHKQQLKVKAEHDVQLTAHRLHGMFKENALATAAKQQAPQKKKRNPEDDDPTYHFNCSRPANIWSTSVWSSKPNVSEDAVIAAKPQLCPCLIADSDSGRNDKVSVLVDRREAFCNDGNSNNMIEEKLICSGDSSMTQAMLPPLRWLHIPKTGTSFAMTIFHVACQFALPPWASIRYSESHPPLQGVLVPFFHACYPSVFPKKCPGLTPTTARRSTGHVAAQPEEMDALGIDPGIPLDELKKSRERMLADNKAGHVLMLTIIRDPYERLVSGYMYNMHDCPHCHKRNTTLDDYASMHLRDPEGWGPAGCVTKMLVGRICHEEYPTEKEVEQAKKFVSEFAFVGLTSEWELSICMAHYILSLYGYKMSSSDVEDAMRYHVSQEVDQIGDGGDSDIPPYSFPVPAMYANVRPGTADRHTRIARSASKFKPAEHRAETAQELRQRAIEGGFEDWADQAVHEAGMEVFRKLKSRYLNQAHCQPPRDGQL
mmetsp:Transcript_2409/g.8671  ORF Transcript_2409/g.8671 Transcript_2409/m.8671 type:complete len:577 (-) Transcript_2409:1013-2743(-)